VTTDQLTEAPPAPNLFAQLRELWLGACGRPRRRRDLETTRDALEHLDDHMRRDIGLSPKEQPLVSRADIILHLHP
jgi:uncharacterized protein YjiS (DUF1127 family)